ncbi:MAG: 6-phosphogluconolactonase [Verrucomicrobiales bacterium]|nr:6-phosphogluconolactonase [Verrucomicrobiales bacterium]
MKPTSDIPDVLDPWIILCRDDRHAAGETARLVLDAFVRDGERDFGLALSGGRMASGVFRELVRQSQERKTPLDVVDFFWADERCVPPSHEDSNYRVARQGLLDPLGVDAGRVHRLGGELPTERAVTLANEQWRRWSERRGGGRGAILDMVLLGVGEDGHIASLFPVNLPADLESASPFRAVIGPKPPPQRLTMGYRLLWEARRVVVTATGAGKEAVLRASLAGREDTPLARVLSGRMGKETVLITDLPGVRVP